MRSVLLALMFSGSVFALSGTAYAQTSPDTRETDQSEEDWRKSQKKGGTSSEDILDIIKNTRSTGVGNGRGYSPIDALPEESRRHLMKERARRMAQAGPNEPVDVTYTPSEAAKSDTNLEADEKAAWEKMAQGMNGAPDQGQQGQGQQGSQGQGQQGQQGSQGQQGQQGQQGSQGQQGQQQDSGQSRSVMRGGSAASVADIMSRIKGLGQGTGGTGQGQGQSPQGQTSKGQPGQSSQGQVQQGQNQQGQSQQGQSQQGQGQQGQGQQGQSQSAQNQQGQQGQSQSQAQNQGQNQGQNQAQSQQDGQQQSDSQSQAQSPQADAKAASQAQDSAQSQNASRVPEAVSPLDRIKEVNREQSSKGTRSSASDYLKKKE